MTEPISESENSNTSKPALPYANTIAWTSALALISGIIELTGGFLTVIPGLVLVVAGWWMIRKAKHLYYRFPDQYSDDSNLKIDQSRLALIAASVIVMMLILRTMVVAIGSMVYS